MEISTFKGHNLAKGGSILAMRTFGDGDVYFGNAIFGNGFVNFGQANFGDGWVYFGRVNFGDGSVDFHGAIFGKGNVDFTGALFGNSDVSFRGTVFGDGDVIFRVAKFGEGTVDFTVTRFGNGDLDFRSIKKGTGHYIFRPRALNNCQLLYFSNATFECPLDISDLDSPVPLNLQNSRLSHPIDIDRANIRFRSAYHYLDFKKAINPLDSTSFRRLKKLAKEADDHERALDFFAKEMRSAYWHSISGPKLALYYLYDWASDYGRSIFRPLVGLLISAFIYMQIYLSFVGEIVSDQQKMAAYKYSVSHILPIYPGS